MTSAAAHPICSAATGRRVVAAATVAAVDIFVTSESNPRLTVQSKSGAECLLGGHVTSLDEVVRYSGPPFVGDREHRLIVAVDPSSWASVPPAVDLAAPPRPAVTATGTHEIVDAGTDTLYSMPAGGSPSERA
jgi:hypothetical protein